MRFLNRSSLFAGRCAVLCLGVSVVLAGCRSGENRSRELPSSTVPASPEVPAPTEPPAAEAVFDGDTAAMERWNAGEISWFSFDEGVEAAQASGKPAMAIVQAEWCPRCTEYAALYGQDAVVESTEDFVMIWLDEDDPAAARLAPDGGYVPRTVFLQPDGTADTSLTSGHPRYGHFLNPVDSAPLLALMDRARSAR